MSQPFCIYPEHAGPIACRLIDEARSAALDMNAPLKRLLSGSESYRLADRDLRRLRLLQKILEEAVGDVLQVIEAEQRKAAE